LPAWAWPHSTIEIENSQPLTRRNAGPVTFSAAVRAVADYAASATVLRGSQLGSASARRQTVVERYGRDMSTRLWRLCSNTGDWASELND
jgi:hypothetical protein